MVKVAVAEGVRGFCARYLRETGSQPAHIGTIAGMRKSRAGTEWLCIAASWKSVPCS